MTFHPWISESNAKLLYVRSSIIINTYVKILFANIFCVALNLEPIFLHKRRKLLFITNFQFF